MRFFTIVPEKSKYLIQRLGKYHKSLEPGFHLMIPFIDVIEHKVSFKEQIIHVTDQRAITKDNVAVTLDGVLFFKIEDEMKASYNIGNYTEGSRLFISPETPRYDIHEIRTGEGGAELAVSVAEGVEREHQDHVGGDDENLGD